MKRHFFINKMNTIFEESKMNFGYSPIVELNYGKQISRILLEVNLEEINNMVKNNTIIDISKLHHTIHMTNCGKDSLADFSRKVCFNECDKKERTSSFDVILFRLPKKFDQGTGSSMEQDIWFESDVTVSSNGSNWFQAKNNDLWKPDEETNMNIDGLGEGVYTWNYLNNEYEKFKNGEESVIFASQHFDSGKEDLNIDVTNEINSYIEDEFLTTDGFSGKIRKNLGFGMAFAPSFESMESCDSQYVGFFSGRTNTRFNPYMETTYDEEIYDNRLNFVKEKENKLYLYCKDNGQYINLDENPVCVIDGKEFVSKQAYKGIYFAVIPANSIEGDNYTIKYDEWLKLSLNGVPIEGQEFSFVLNPSHGTTSFNVKNDYTDDVYPSIYGINENEELNRENEIELGVIFDRKYSMGEKTFVSSAEYRIRRKEGESYETIFDFTPINLMNGLYSFMLYTNDFVPGKYIVDIRAKNGMSMKTYENVTNFKIINDITEK